MKAPTLATTEREHERNAQLRRAERAADAPIKDGADLAGLMARLQRSAGNQAINDLVRDYAGRRRPEPVDGSGAGLQRHPDGANLLPDQDEAVVSLKDPPPLAGGATATAAASPQGAQTDAPDQSQAAAPAPSAPAPAPASAQAMSLAQAQKILQASYGHVHTIVQGNLVLLADQAATWAKYDQINRGRHNPYSGQPWKDGDAQQYIPGLQGFADKDTGTSYVNGQTPLNTVTAHEMLHLNTASDFRGAVGETLNEGATEYFASKALTAAGVAIVGSTGYAQQISIVQSLMGVVGEGTVMEAYFGGADVLVNAFEAFRGSGTFAQLKGYAEALDATHATQLLGASTLTDKIAAINKLLDGWVSDDDLTAIQGICESSNEAEMTAIRAAIQPRIKDLWSIGQRTRLRVILGTV
jgi:hypothetical protein